MSPQALLPAAALAARLEPYKKLLGVLVRQSCVSVAVSNPYLNLAEPLGAVMLREGRLPARSFTRLLAGEQQQLAGFVLAFEVQDDLLAQQQQQQQSAPTTSSQGITPQQQAAVTQVRAALESLQPGLMGGWCGPWSAATAGASCRILPPAGPSAAAAASAVAGAGSAATATVDTRSSSSVVQQEGQLHTAQNEQLASHQQEQQQQQQRKEGPPPPQQPLCSLGQQFLQSYLDSLGSLNTFG